MTYKIKKQIDIKMEKSSFQKKITPKESPPG